jgi:ketosteroid isomerase-like protein
MAEHLNATIAREAMEAFNRGDLEAFAAAVHDEVVWHAPGDNRFSGEFRGKAAALGRFKEQAEAGVRLRFTDLHDVTASDEHVVALLRVRFEGPGGELENPSVFVMHVREDKLVEFWAMNERQADVDRVIDG